MKHPPLPLLKSCPCCKSTEILRGFSTDDITRSFIRCKECGIEVSRIVTEHRTPKRALLGCTVVWNTRPAETDPRHRRAWPTDADPSRRATGSWRRR